MRRAWPSARRSSGVAQCILAVLQFPCPSELHSRRLFLWKKAAERLRFQSRSIVEPRRATYLSTLAATNGVVASEIALEALELVTEMSPDPLQTILQGLKPTHFLGEIEARLKPCPFKTSFMQPIQAATNRSRNPQSVFREEAFPCRFVNGQVRSDEKCVRLPAGVLPY